MVTDVQELHSWLIDLSVLQLLEEKKLKKSDFIVTENYHLRLKPATAKMLIEKIQLNMNRKIPYKHGKQYSYQSILLDCVQQLANLVIGKRKALELRIPAPVIRRTDPLELQKRILAMSPDEMRRLRINKSTFWYPKRNLAGGRKQKLYRKSILKMS